MTKGDRRQSVIDKIMKSVEVKADTGCWIWTGPDSGKNGRGRGYPRMNLDGCTVAVHRALFTCVFGYIPPKKTLDHTCRTRLCINPHHQEIVTHKENCRRRDRARKTTIEREGAGGRGESAGQALSLHLQ